MLMSERWNEIINPPVYFNELEALKLYPTVSESDTLNISIAYILRFYLFYICFISIK